METARVEAPSEPASEAAPRELTAAPSAELTTDEGETAGDEDRPLQDPEPDESHQVAASLVGLRVRAWPAAAGASAPEVVARREAIIRGLDTEEVRQLARGALQHLCITLLARHPPWRRLLAVSHASWRLVAPTLQCV